jgi:hypothetical protein
MSVYLVLRHPDAPQLWVNAWTRGTCLIQTITTDKTVSDRCQNAMRNDEYVYVHRCAWGSDRASVVSKAKVRKVTSLGAGPFDYYVVFENQSDVGREPLRQVDQGTRSYIERAVDG